VISKVGVLRDSVFSAVFVLKEVTSIALLSYLNPPLLFK